MKHLRRMAARVLMFSGAMVPLQASAQTCPILSRQTVEQTTGFPVGPARIGVDNGRVTTCSFRTGESGDISILVRRHVGRVWIAEQQQRMERGALLGTFRRVDGIGERAFALDLRTSGAALCVFRGNDYLQVTLVHAGTQEVAVKLAQAAFTSLGEMQTDLTLNVQARAWKTR